MEQLVLNMWNYYLIIDRDMKDAMRYIDSRNSENVFSFEFAKNIILACTECESAFKLLGTIKESKELGNIGEYKGLILKHFPKITTANVYANGVRIVPFSNWDNGTLGWWEAYVGIKHNRSDNFQDASFNNAANAVGALYVLILYLSQVTGVNIYSDEALFITSNYGKTKVLYDPIMALPDF